MKKFLIGAIIIFGFCAFALNAAEISSNPGANNSAPFTLNNDPVNFLYQDALNLYKEGQYLKAANTLEKILGLLAADHYVSGMRRAFRIKPDDAMIRELLSKSKNKDAALLDAKQAFKNADYAYAARIFSALQEESPQSKDINKYIEKIAELRAKEKPLHLELTKVEEPKPEVPKTQERKAAESQEYNSKRQFAMEEMLLSIEEKAIAEKEAELKQMARAKDEEEAKLKNKQKELARRRGELQAKISEMKRSVAQEKAMIEAMLLAQQEEEAKLKKVEMLWQRARKLYSQGRYEQAVKDFQEIIEIEGNPRIKYTPYAKEYIEKAKDRMVERKTAELSGEVERAEKNMVNEVLKQQIPPYMEPPVSTESAESVPLIEPPAIRKRLKAKKINLDFDKVDLKSVLFFLSQESGVNFIASQKVLDLPLKVTARFTEMPADEVIKYVSKSLGLVYRIDKDTVWIAHPDEIANEAPETRIYYLTKGGGLFTEFTPISASSETALGGSSAQISKISTIEDTLKEVIPWPGDSKLTYDKRLNALIVRNTPQNLQILEDLLYSLDIAPYQILIEARFMEVTMTDTDELGLEWQINSNLPLEKKRGEFQHGIYQNSGIDFTSFTNVSSGLNLTYKGLLTRPQFQAVLHAYQQNKKVKTLSSPRITTLNNQLATIKVVDEWIYPTRYEYEIVQTDNNGDGDFNDAGETTYKNVPKDFLRRDVGILLKVIPSVGSDRKTINLSLIPEVSEGTASGFSYSGDVTLPKFTSRNLSTTVIVNSGDTVVLGGLMKESRTKTVTKMPILGDIPLLGGLFRKNEDSIERKNLLIFVTAKVLSATGEEVVVASK